MGRIRKSIYTLPARLAPYLINGDASGMTDEDRKEIDDFIKKHRLGSCLTCSGMEDGVEAWFAHSNDMNRMGDDVYYFTFIRLPKKKAYPKTIDKIITKVDGKFGAPMGRPCDDIAARPLVKKVYDCAVPMCSSDCSYDKGGAYWGRGAQLRVEYTKDLTYIRFYRKGE